MARLYLVRHAQASLLSDDYDRLSPLGVAQSDQLGAWFAARGEQISVAVSGSLKRQTATASACLAQMSAPPPLQIDTGFDEYSHDELFGTPLDSGQTHATAAAQAQASENPRKAYQALISHAFAQWISAADDSNRPRSWARFRADAVAALERAVRQCGPGGNGIVVSSGGVIAALCQQLLGLPDDRVAALHWGVYNASVTRLLCSGDRITLSGFNAISHLEGAASGDAMVSYR